MKLAQKRISKFPGFSREDMKAIRHGNALELFPGILDRLRGRSRYKTVIKIAARC